MLHCNYIKTEKDCNDEELYVLSGIYEELAKRIQIEIYEKTG